MPIDVQRRASEVHPIPTSAEAKSGTKPALEPNDAPCPSFLNFARM
jgi:hypothetical protein